METTKKFFCFAAFLIVITHAEDAAENEEFKNTNLSKTKHIENASIAINSIHKESEFRGIISNLFNRPNHHEPQDMYESTSLFRPPQFVSDTQMVPPSVQVPTYQQLYYENSNNNHQHHRPSLLGSLFSSIDKDKDKSRPKAPCLGLNMDWVKYALQKCSRIDPELLTAVLPTKYSSINTPKMYYFENNTGNAKTFAEAEEWCTSKGMDLVTIDDIKENKILQDKISQILGTSSATDDPNAADKFWVGLNDIDDNGRWTYRGDSTSTFVDWHVNEPDTTVGLCASYAQLNTAGNIHLQANDCGTTSRFICELDEACTALFAAMYPKQQHHSHSHGHGSHEGHFSGGNHGSGGTFPWK